MSKNADSNLVEDFAIELNQLKESLDMLGKDLDAVQKGNDDGVYWNGSNAYNSIMDSLTQVDYNKNLIEELDKCYNYLQSLND